MAAEQIVKTAEEAEQLFAGLLEEGLKKSTRVDTPAHNDHFFFLYTLTLLGLSEQAVLSMISQVCNTEDSYILNGTAKMHVTPGSEGCTVLILVSDCSSEDDMNDARKLGARLFDQGMLTSPVMCLAAYEYDSLL